VVPATKSTAIPVQCYQFQAQSYLLIFKIKTFLVVMNI
jgi:hypothetical protein